jgi:hypothetical protein
LLLHREDLAVDVGNILKIAFASGILNGEVRLAGSDAHMQSEVGLEVGIDLRDQVESRVIRDRNILRMDDDLNVIVEILRQTRGYAP